MSDPTPLPEVPCPSKHYDDVLVRCANCGGVGGDRRTVPASPPGIVLSLCDRTGVMVEPWREAGYDCWIVDTQHEAGTNVGPDGITRVGADVVGWLPPRTDYRIVFGFPPCTNLANSGARWFKDKGLTGLADGLRVVEACRNIAEWSDAPWMLENPMGTLSTYWRQPDYSFDPCDYGRWVDGDRYVKRTCLWVGGGFIIPPHRPVTPDQGSLMHLMAPTADRGDRRSVTPAGFARAVFEANENGVVDEHDGLWGDAC